MKAAIGRARWLLSLLLLLGAALFAIGVGIERGSADVHHDEAATVESGEHAGGELRETHAATESHEEGLLGLDLESTRLVIVGVAASIALALLVWFKRDAWVLWVVAGFAALFTAFDIAEVAHQVRESRGRLAAWATLVAAVHVAAVIVAVITAQSDSAIV